MDGTVCEYVQSLLGKGACPSTLEEIKQLNKEELKKLKKTVKSKKKEFVDDAEKTLILTFFKVHLAFEKKINKSLAKFALSQFFKLYLSLDRQIRKQSEAKVKDPNAKDLNTENPNEKVPNAQVPNENYQEKITEEMRSKTKKIFKILREMNFETTELKKFVYSRYSILEEKDKLKNRKKLEDDLDKKTQDLLDKIGDDWEEELTKVEETTAQEQEAEEIEVKKQLELQDTVKKNQETRKRKFEDFQKSKGSKKNDGSSGSIFNLQTRKKRKK